MNSARLVLSKEADSFLLPHESSGGEIESNSTQTFYGTITYNNSEPGENWALSYSFPDFQFPFDEIASPLYLTSCCSGNTKEEQYFVLITIFYKYINGQWEKIFDAEPFLIDKFGSNYISPIVHTSGDGKYVTCIYSSFPAVGDVEPPTSSVPIFCSDDSGKTWNTVIVDNPTDIDEFSWINFAISKSGQYQTASYVAASKKNFKSGLYYSIDYGKTWNSNKDIQEFFFLSVTMNYSGTIQYGTGSNQIVGPGISKSIDYGKTWKTIANFDSVIVYSSVSTNSDGSVISLVNTTAEGEVKFFYSTDFGKTISKSTVPILGNLSLFKGNICMNDSGQYQTFGGIFNENETDVPYSTIFYSNDYGKTWFESDILKLSNSPYFISNVATTNSGLYQTASASGIVTNNKGEEFYSAQIYVSETPP